ncbi:alkaline phosphatase D family protein [Pseudoalteromonas sp. 5Ae-yellow]|uniref:alkaline phosphatase D family protein n=1 Tax=Pseudoalteromonas sp. 5Ae-yellow TaxID=2759847 RepID=UPI0015F50799|nr:alkaline phosphatase D family protein [Pseudoalteromonas sp. 5Ae-yellow]MBA6407912.1 alkaline phosphatase D family protein [Pseudoalteromonas sp. 5Ae-yellow]
MTLSSRRNFLKTSAASIFTVAVSSAITGCAQTLINKPLSAIEFKHGVASGDPLSNALIIWTRATTAQSNFEVTVAWELASDSQFKNIIRSGREQTDKSRDFTIKIDVQELAPNTEYFYRFVGLNTQSPIGRAKTLPINNVEQIKMAVVSCSNYPAGYFNAYTDAAKQKDLDVVLHLGDYIYEYPMGGYATENAENIGRQLAADNSGEIITLSDYRKRYAIYRTDQGLQALHAAAPFIAIWDDHEVTNDTYKSGAENHTPDEGDFFKRRAAAIQAYYEWLPIRPPMGEQSPQIYRTFDFGNLISLHMLDTRVIARDKQLAYSDYKNLETKQMDVARFASDLNNPNRQLLGNTQLNWLTSAITKSNAKWQVLGQQVLMTKMWLPTEIFSQSDRTKIPQVLKELVAIKKAVLANKAVTAEQLARVNTLMPYNLDAWDGYPSEREALYKSVTALNKKLVVVAGDTHNAWHGTLKNAKGESVGVEFATPGVTSPGMEHYLALNTAQAKQMADSLSLLINDLNYCDLSHRGYMLLTITKEQITTDWRYIDNINSPSYNITDQHQSVYKG